MSTDNEKPVGNAAAMREALENAYSLLCEGIATEVDDELEHPFHLELACEVIQDALSAPPRQCDVGTAEEQIRRWSLFCKKHDRHYPPMHGFEWAQMPYEAQEGGAK